VPQTFGTKRDKLWKQWGTRIVRDITATEVKRTFIVLMLKYKMGM
jgi:hypothetical protein